MKAGVVAMMLVAVVLAGCSEGAAPSEAVDDGFDDVQVDVDEQTGAIRGVVVNDGIIPVAGAAVKVLNTEMSAQTDDQGRFAFSKVEPGTYFLQATKDLHEPVQSSVEVKAGLKDPPVVRLQLNRLFKGEPYLTTIADEGFFTCTQAGMPGYLYSSSPCHSIAPGARLCEDLQVYCVPQTRDFHADVGAGWQTQIWEMMWEPSATGTSENMGIVVSTYKPERTGGHQFAEFEGASPIYGRLDCAPDEDGECTPAPTGVIGSPSAIPAEGWKDMSYFMSVRPPDGAACVLWCAPPGIAVDQSFDVWLTQFYYAPSPEGWSFINGSPNPF